MRGSRLVVRRGASLDVLRAVAGEVKAAAVLWNRRYEPAIVERDRRLKQALRDDGLVAKSFNAALPEP